MRIPEIIPPPAPPARAPAEPAQLDRIEAMLAQSLEQQAQLLEQQSLLLALLVDDGADDEGDDDLVRSLDGTVLGGPRDTSAPL